MIVDKLVIELLQLQKQGYGRYDVCYLYGEDGIEVRDTIKHVDVADPADGKEIHLWQ